MLLMGWFVGSLICEPAVLLAMGGVLLFIVMSSVSVWQGLTLRGGLRGDACLFCPEVALLLGVCRPLVLGTSIYIIVVTVHRSTFHGFS